MLPIILLCITLTLSLTITRIGTLALRLTGMSADAAHFQARSAFYGVGFTTHESENVVNHPVRRRIITLLMMLGNLGIATVVATLMVSFIMASGTGEWIPSLLTLLGGLAVLMLAANSRWLDRIMSRVVTAALRRWTTLDVQDYVSLLNLSSGYAVLEIHVQADGPLSGMTLRELRVSHRGILVLGVQHADRAFVGVPPGRTKIAAHDKLVLYGPIKRLKRLVAHSAAPVTIYSHHLSAEEQSPRGEEGEILRGSLGSVKAA